MHAVPRKRGDAARAVCVLFNRYGRSLGSGPTCQLAEELAADGVELGGIMLQSPLASAFRVAFNFRFTMPGDLFPNIDRIKSVACAVFIVHGTRCVSRVCVCVWSVIWGIFSWYGWC